MHLWERPVIVFFATRFNRKLEVYYSVVPDFFAVAEGALQHSRDNLEVYSFPSFCLIHHVLNRVMISQILRMTLDAPLWPQAKWFLDLLSLLSAVPREISSWHNLLCQPHVERYRRSVGSLSLHSWRLSSTSCERGAFLAEQ